jgi:AmpD protein
VSGKPNTGVQTGLWHEGWYRYAHRLDSPNFGARPAGLAIDLIVIHAISLPPGQFGQGHVQELFTNQLDWQAHPYFESIRGLQVSAHFFIGRDGALWQFVASPDRAWHAGQSHYLGRDNCNDYSIGIELEGVDDGPFEAAQYETLSSLCAASWPGMNMWRPGASGTLARALTGPACKRRWACLIAISQKILLDKTRTGEPARRLWPSTFPRYDTPASCH